MDYIQDSTSTNGQYQGQIQLNLSSISSQAAFVNWQEAVIQLPIKLQILNGPTTVTSANYMGAPTIDQLIPKNGSWQFIDSVSAVIDGVTVQTNQVHENVNATLKALTEWTERDVAKYGSTSNFSLDHYETLTQSVAQSLENMATENFTTNGTTSITSTGTPGGTTPGTFGEFGMANTVVNAGARERSLFTAVSTTAGSLAYEFAGSTANMSQVAKPQVHIAPTGADVIAGAPFYVAHYIATIRLADICDYFKKCPMSKNVKGFIY